MKQTPVMAAKLVFADLMNHSEPGFIRKTEERFLSTCGNCQLVCWQTRQQRRENYDILVNSGIVAEGTDFSFQVERPEGPPSD